MPEKPSRPRHRSGVPSNAVFRRWTLAAVFIIAMIAVFLGWDRRSRSQRTASIGATNSSLDAQSPFAPTIANRIAPPSPAPNGMVWIPGGEFSMGSDAASEAVCGRPGVTRDALPVHRVYVDAFWMD